ncbi:MAG: AraC family transcriptional regulator [Pseudomonadota bacterium]
MGAPSRSSNDPAEIADRPAITLEEAVAKKFRLQRAPTLFAQRKMAAPMAFSRLRCDGIFPGRTSAVPAEEAFTFQVALAPMQTGDIWIAGKHGKLNVAPGDTFTFDLSANPIANLIPPYDFLRFYLPVRTLDELAYDRGLRRVGGLRTNAVGIQDPVMRGLAMAVLPAFQDPGAGTALFLDAIALALHAHVMFTYGGVLGERSSVRAGLAPWQLRRAHEFIEANLARDPSIADLARECRLSASHFARAFRQATGMPPHRWLTQRRVERAKELLLLERSPDLTQIALACGFVDQSHLTRVFARYEKYSPGKWRRLRSLRHSADAARRIRRVPVV